MELVLKLLLLEDVFLQEFRGTIQASLPEIGLEKQFVIIALPLNDPPSLIIWRDGKVFVEITGMLTDEAFLSHPGPQQAMLPFFLQILFSGTQIIQHLKEEHPIDEMAQAYQTKGQRWCPGSQLTLSATIKEELLQEWVFSALK